jgi:hypothetical protein
MSLPLAILAPAKLESQKFKTLWLLPPSVKLDDARLFR